jgi:hypothetical protein
MGRLQVLATYKDAPIRRTSAAKDLESGERQARNTATGSTVSQRPQAGRTRPTRLRLMSEENPKLTIYGLKNPMTPNARNRLRQTKIPAKWNDIENNQALN